MKIKAKETKTIETIEDIELDEITIKLPSEISAIGKDGVNYVLEPNNLAFLPKAIITADGIKFNCELTVKSKLTNED